VHGNRQKCKAKVARRNLRQLQSRNLATTISEQKPQSFSIFSMKQFSQ
jgi:hypothetical protein